MARDNCPAPLPHGDDFLLGEHREGVLERGDRQILAGGEIAYRWQALTRHEVPCADPFPDRVGDLPPRRATVVRLDR